MTKTLDTIAVNSPFAMFETDPEIEKSGVRLDYGKFYIVVARAGGANDRFRQVLRAKMEPHRRAMQTETMDDDLADRLAIEAFAEAVVLSWGHETTVEGKIVDHAGQIIWRDGSVREFSVDAVKELFRLLPDLARDVMGQAQRTALFRKTVNEVDAGN